MIVFLRIIFVLYFRYGSASLVHTITSMINTLIETAMVIIMRDFLVLHLVLFPSVTWQRNYCWSTTGTAVARLPLIKCGNHVVIHEAPPGAVTSARSQQRFKYCVVCGGHVLTCIYTYIGWEPPDRTSECNAWVGEAIPLAHPRWSWRWYTLESLFSIPQTSAWPRTNNFSEAFERKSYEYRGLSP